MIDALKTIPGVQRVALVNRFPPLAYTAGFRTEIFDDQTSDLRSSNALTRAFYYEVSPEYFRAAGTAMLAGRDFSWHDDESAPAVAVVNREFARRFFGSVTGAMGRYYKLRDGTRVQVVGVVEDGRYQTLTEDQHPATFHSFLQSPPNSAYFVVRSSGDKQQLAAAMKKKFRELDAGLPVGINTWNTVLDVVMFPSRVATMALGVLGAMGALLSVTGIFGIAAYSVSRRLKELGIRIAIGARRGEVLKTALGRAVKLLALGSCAGMALGLLASRVLAAIVFQATPRDPVVLASAVLVMMLVGLAATWLPAQRAMSLDPLKLLREE
jgi:ABC-type antimicrobial peptide transport system permease subunit